MSVSSTSSEHVTCPVCKKRSKGYEATKVYVSAKCPICLDEKEPVQALRCGHVLCTDDFSNLCMMSPAADESMNVRSVRARTSSRQYIPVPRINVLFPSHPQTNLSATQVNGSGSQCGEIVVRGRRDGGGGGDGNFHINSFSSTHPFTSAMQQLQIQQAMASTPGAEVSRNDISFFALDISEMNRNPFAFGMDIIASGGGFKVDLSRDKTG